MNVHRTLGKGFLENVYSSALGIELELHDIAFRREVPFEVQYRNRLIGKYFADFVVQNQLILEIKAVPTLNNQHQAQLLNYLTASGIQVGLLLNFGVPSLQIKRIANHYSEQLRI